MSDKKDFNEIYKLAKKWHCDVAVVYFLENTNKRLAVITGKKIGNAVVRNHSRRVIKSIFYSLRNEISCGEYIFIVKSKISQTNFSQIEKSLKWALKRLGAIK
nr:ribonuclease P protein component [Campylobacter hominis]